MWVMQFGKKQKGPIIRINILCGGRTKASIKYEAGSIPTRSRPNKETETLA
jgi:hypothetical protein